MADLNNGNPININVNVPGAVVNPQAQSPYELLITTLMQNGTVLSDLREMMNNSAFLSFSANELKDLLKKSDSKTATSINKLSKTVSSLLEQMEGENSPLKQQLTAISEAISVVRGEQQSTSQILGRMETVQLETLNLLKRVLERSEPIVQPQSAENTKTENNTVASVVEGEKKELVQTQESEDKVEDKAVEEEKKPQTDTQQPQPASTGKKAPVTSEKKPVVEPKPEPKVVEDPEVEPEYLKAHFLSEAVKQTKILAEPKKPWYKKLAHFAVNHPVLTGIIGAGIGFGLVGAAIGLSTAVGAAGMSFGYVMSVNLPSMVIGTGLGAIAGGATSLTSRLFKSGKKQRLYNKYLKQHAKTQLIEKVVDFSDAIVQKIDEKEKETLDKIRKGPKALRWFHRMKHSAAAKVREIVSDKMSPTMGRKLTESVYNSVTTKNKLDVMEDKVSGDGKTLALAGYRHKIEKVQKKLAAGKISKETAKMYIEGYEAAVEGLKGGAAGAGESKQGTFDYEVLKDIEVANKKGASLEVVLKARQKKKMNIATESKTFEVTKARILDRNSIKTPTLVEKVYRDPRQQIEEIMKLRAEGKEEEANRLQAELDKLNDARIAAIEYQKSQGMTLDDPISCDKDGNEL